MRRLKTVRRPPIYPKTPGHLPCSSLTHPLPLSSRRPSVSFGGFGFSENPSGVSTTREVESYEDPAAGPRSATEDSGKLDELAVRVEELEQALADSKTLLDELKNGLTQAEDRIRTVSGTSATVGQVAQQLQSLNATVAAITGQLGGTPGYGAQHTFVCSSCQTHGKVALALNPSTHRLAFSRVKDSRKGVGEGQGETGFPGICVEYLRSAVASQGFFESPHRALRPYAGVAMRGMARGYARGLSRPGARLRGRWVSCRLASGRERMASRAKARLNWVSQGQRRGRCKVRRRAERVVPPERRPAA